MSDKRKIIEIYATEEEDGTVYFNFEKIENTDMANNAMKMVLSAISTSKFKDEIIDMEVTKE